MIYFLKILKSHFLNNLVESTLSPTECTTDTILTCLPGSEIRDIKKFSISNKTASCNEQIDGLFSGIYNITLKDGCKTTLSFKDQPLKAVVLNGSFLSYFILITNYRYI